ncbi:MAG: co-chaperone HscB [Parashewanella sp.]
MNYFELFGFNTDYSIDQTQLSERYRELQRLVHPDKFANNSEQEKLLAIQKTAQINDGYQTLKDPICRAEHILQLRGIDISHETTTVKDTSFLMQQMQWREDIEDIQTHADPHTAIDHLAASFNEYKKTIFAELTSSLDKNNRSDNQLVAEQIRKLKFMAKLQDELIRIEDAIFDL